MEDDFRARRDGPGEVDVSHQEPGWAARSGIVRRERGGIGITFRQSDEGIGRETWWRVERRSQLDLDFPDREKS